MSGAEQVGGARWPTGGSRGRGGRWLDEEEGGAGRGEVALAWEGDRGARGDRWPPALADGGGVAWRKAGGEAPSGAERLPSAASSPSIELEGEFLRVSCYENAGDTKAHFLLTK